MKEFNIVVVGVGGQGILTMQSVISEAALLQGLDVNTSELHGLAQRGGSVASHIRFGKKIYSSLVLTGKANLVFGLEPLETLRKSFYGSKKNKTVFIFDSFKSIPVSVPVLKDKYPDMKEIVKDLKKFSKKVYDLDASEIVKKEVGSVAPTNIFLLGFACGKKLMPLKKKFLLEAIKENVPEKYFEINKKVFELGMKQ